MRPFRRLLQLGAVAFALRPFAASASGPEDTPPVYLLTYDHGGLILWGADHFRGELRRAMTWLERYPGFKIGLDNEAYVYDYLAEHDPTLLAELQGDLKKYSGRFGIGTCTYGQPLSAFINDESNIRQIGYAIKTDQKQLGYTPVVYLMSEHAMHSQIPQILDGFSFKRAIMRTHWMMYGYNPTFDVPIGWWVGMDGSRIATVPTYPGEGGVFGQATIDSWMLCCYPRPDVKFSPADFRKQFGHINPLLASRADDSSSRKEELVKQFPGGNGYQWILLDELPSLFPTPESEMKPLPNDFTVRMPWGYCGNEIWNLSRKAEVQVLTAERLAAVELLLGGADREPELERAWKNLLVGQHHDVQICGLIADARRFLSGSLDESNGVLNSSLQFVASRMKCDGLAQVTVFNPLSWPRHEWIEAEMTLPKASAAGVAVRHGGRSVPSVVLKSERSSGGFETRVAFLAELPPMAFASYSIVPDTRPSPMPDDKVAVDFEKLHITTPFLEAQLNPEGGISSLIDKRTGAALFAAGKRSAFFAGRINGRDCESKGTWILHAASGGRPWADAREYGFIGGIPYNFELRFRADTARLDCRVSFHFEGERIGHLSDDLRDSTSPFIHEEKLRFKLFPAIGEGATGVRDLPFTVSETSNHYVEGVYWTAVADDQRGVAFFNRGTMGAVREDDGGFSLPLAYAMHCIWGERMLTGDFTYEFAAEPFVGKWRAADLHRKAMAFNFPFLSTCGNPGSGKLGDTLQPLEVGSDDVLISALYPENGRAFVRLFEFSGQSGRSSIAYGNGGAEFRMTDLLGHGDQLASGPISFRPWQFQTLRIELKH
jgi:alpha-mannosidase